MKIYPPYGYNTLEHAVDITTLDDLRNFTISIFQDPPNELRQDILKSDEQTIIKNLKKNGFKVKGKL